MILSKVLCKTADIVIKGEKYMQIQSYQINNVLNQYRKQLGQDNNKKQQNEMFAKSMTDRVSLSGTAKRKAVIDQVAKDIISKITNYNTNSQKAEKGTDNQSKIENNSYDLASEKEARFVFNTVDEGNNKTTAFISVENSGGLVNRLDQTVRAELF